MPAGNPRGTIHLFFNPASGGFTPARAERLLIRLRAAGLTVHPYYPHAQDEAQQTIAALCAQATTPPTVIAVGGDGTVNTVINSMPQGKATLGVIPLGTANVTARELGIRSLRDAVNRIVRGAHRPFAVGEATSSVGTRRFILMAGIGCDAAAVAAVRPSEKRLFGKGAYILAGLRQYLQWDRSPLTITVAGHAITCTSAIIANAAHYAGPYRLAPQAGLLNDQLQIVPITFNRSLDLIRFTLSVLARRRFETSASLLVQQETITVSGGKPVQLDGDPFGSTPLTIRLLPAFNNLIV